MRTPKNFATVAESVRETPSTSIYHRPQQLNISQISLSPIYRKDLGMMPYKVQMKLKLKSAWDQLTEDADFGKK